jgi:hypothetical protein
MNSLRPKVLYRPVTLGFCGAALFLFSALSFAEGTASSNWLDNYFESTLFELRGYTDFYHKKQSEDLWNGQYAGGLRLKVENHYSLSDYWSLNSSLRLQLEHPNYRKGVFPGPDSSEPESPYADFQVLNLFWEGEENAFLAGKEVLKLGFSHLYSPVDRFHTIDWTIPEHNEPNGDFQLSFFHYLEEDTIQITAFPYGQQDFRKTGSSGQKLTPEPDRDKDPAALILYDAVRQGFDFYLGGHYGSGAYPIIDTSSGTQAVVLPLSATVLGGVIATHNGWTLFADGLFQHSIDKEDENFARFSMGGSYATDIGELLNIESFTPTLTYCFEEVTQQARSATVASSKNQRINANNLLSEFRFRIDSDFFVTVGDNYSFDNKLHQFAIGGGYSVTDSITLALANTFTADNTPENASGGYTSLSISLRF